jgi:anti-sigma-K factor RskA
MRISHPKLVEHLASQYALGTLAGGTRRRFEAMLLQRADLRLAVAQWQQHLAPLAQAVPDMQRPSARVWQRVAAQTKTNTKTPSQAGPVTSSWLRPAGWGLGGIALGLIAASALLVLAPSALLSTDKIAMLNGEKLPQSYIGLLSDAQGNGKLLVSSLRHGRTATLKLIGPLAPPQPPNTHYILWALPAEGPAFMLGALPEKGSASVQLADTSEKLLAKVSKLQVTLETSAQPSVPSSAVALAGNCAKLW